MPIILNVEFKSSHFLLYTNIYLQDYFICIHSFHRKFSPLSQFQFSAFANRYILRIDAEL